MECTQKLIFFFVSPLVFFGRSSIAQKHANQAVTTRSSSQVVRQGKGLSKKTKLTTKTNTLSVQCPTLALPCNVSFTPQTAFKSTYFGRHTCKRKKQLCGFRVQFTYWTDFLHFFHLLVEYSYTTQKKVFRKVIYIYIYKKSGVVEEQLTGYGGYAARSED